MPNVKVGFVGASMTSVFEEVMQSSKRTLSVAFAPSKESAKMQSLISCFYKRLCFLLYVFFWPFSILRMLFI
ncbi:hypothetical protein ACB098_10G069400 [Castanea mollissima]